MSMVPLMAALSAAARSKGVPANALKLNGQVIRLNGQSITLRQGS